MYERWKITKICTDSFAVNRLKTCTFMSACNFASVISSDLIEIYYKSKGKELLYLNDPGPRKLDFFLSFSLFKIAVKQLENVRK